MKIFYFLITISFASQLHIKFNDKTNPPISKVNDEFIRDKYIQIEYNRDLILNINFGTKYTHTTTSINGNILEIKDEYGKTKIQSIVSFLPNGKVVIGENSVKLMKKFQNIQNTVYNFKRFIGLTYFEIQNKIQNLTYEVINFEEVPKIKITLIKYDSDGLAYNFYSYYTFTEVFQIFISHIKLYAENTLKGSVYSKSIINAPSYFTLKQHNIINDALEKIELKCLKIIKDNFSQAIYNKFYLNDNTKYTAFLQLTYSGIQFDLMDMANGISSILHYYSSAVSSEEFIFEINNKISNIFEQNGTTYEKSNNFLKSHFFQLADNLYTSFLTNESTVIEMINLIKNPYDQIIYEDINFSDIAPNINVNLIPYFKSNLHRNILTSKNILKLKFIQVIAHINEITNGFIIKNNINFKIKIQISGHLSLSSVFKALIENNLSNFEIEYITDETIISKGLFTYSKLYTEKKYYMINQKQNLILKINNGDEVINYNNFNNLITTYNDIKNEITITLYEIDNFLSGVIHEEREIEIKKILLKNYTYNYDYFCVVFSIEFEEFLSTEIFSTSISTFLYSVLDIGIYLTTKIEVDHYFNSQQFNLANEYLQIQSFNNYDFNFILESITEVEKIYNDLFSV